MRTTKLKPSQVPHTLADLADVRIWAAWKEITRNGKATKPPINARTGRNASVNKPETFRSTRAQARACAEKLVGKLKGVGILLGDVGDGYFLAGIDLDSCFTEKGELLPWARKIIEKLNAYAEYSPSKTGVHLLFIVKAGDVPRIRKLLSGAGHGTERSIGPHCGYAFYLDHKFLTVTGSPLDESSDELPVVSFETVRWLLTAQIFSAQEKKGNGNDNSRSGMAFAVACRLFRRGKSREYVRNRLLNEPDDVGTWAKTKGSDRGGHELNNILNNAEREASKDTHRSRESDDEGGSRFRLLRRGEYRNAPLPTYLFDGLLPEKGVVVVVGHSQALKTFVSLDLCASISTGEPAFGTLTPQLTGASIYVAGEGQSSIKAQRVLAWEKAHNLDLDKFPFYLVVSMPIAADESQFAELADEVENAVGDESVRIIVLDPLANMQPGLQENSTGDMMQCMAAAKMLAEKFDCLVVVIHHPRKADQGEEIDPRGAGAIFAAADCVIAVVRKTIDLAIRTRLIVKKMKDGEIGKAIDLKADIIPLGTNDAGQRISSLVLRALNAQESEGLKVAATDLPSRVAEALDDKNAREGGRSLSTPELAQAILDMQDTGGAGLSKADLARKRLAIEERLKSMVRGKVVNTRLKRLCEHDGRVWRWRLPE